MFFSLLRSMAALLALTGVMHAQTVSTPAPVTGPVPAPPPGVTVSLQVPLYEFAVPSSLQVATNTGVTSVAPWFPCTFVTSNGTSKDIPVTYLGNPKVIFTLYDAAGTKVWSNTASEAQTSTPGVIARRGQVRVIGNIPLFKNDAPLPAGSYALVASLNADKAFSAQAFITLTSYQVPNVNTGLSGVVLQGSGDAAKPVANARVSLVEVLPPGMMRPAQNRSATTDGDGKFKLQGLPAVSFSVTAYPPPGSTGLAASEPRTVAVKEGEISDAGTLTLRPAPVKPVLPPSTGGPVKVN
ncbi:MAG: carboxypeptidase regulatory-like domain-containing protein [Acidobacteria bacterium]|nr:carboxypeptidase regulatory-like domain-containing protein [Acidobacteriota bacterium]